MKIHLYISDSTVVIQSNTTEQVLKEYISFQEALDTFSYKLSDACLTSKESSSFCPTSKSADGVCKSTLVTWNDLSDYITKRSEPVPLIADHQYFFPLEKTILSFPPLQVNVTYSCHRHASNQTFRIIRH